MVIPEMQKRFVLLRAALVVVVLVFLSTSLILAYAAYDLLSHVTPGCGADSPYTPAHYTIADVDTTPYLMPRYEDVRFPSRQRPLQLAAFWIPTDSPKAVIIVHGYSACRRSPTSLLPAGMLNKAGFNVLVLDVRDVGDSQVEDGRSAAGTEEYLDLLGAWDWLQQTQGISPDQIGIMGYSLGGAVAINAAGIEPGIQAVWTDSAFARLNDVLDDKTRQAEWLRPLQSVAILLGRLISGDDLYALTPLTQAQRIGNRPLYLVHGTADELVPYQQLGLLVEAARSGGGAPQVWTTQSNHVASMMDQTRAYEQRLVAFFNESLAQ
jgi:uncharacterized protein